MTLPMFNLPQTAAVGEPTKRRAATKPKPDAIRWSKFRPQKRVACDDCLQDLVEAGAGPVARDARWRRVQHGGDRDRLLCTDHMEAQRHLDGLAPLVDTDGRLR